jgi:hypothetical protein
MKTLLLISLLLNVSVVLADGDHAAPPTSDGAAKLLEDGDFSLSPAAEKRLGIEWLTLQEEKQWKVPLESIVKIKFTKAVYRKFEGRITLVILESIKAEGKHATISSADLQAGDEIAVKGTKFLRLAEVDISSGSVDSCSH